MYKSSSSKVPPREPDNEDNGARPARRIEVQITQGPDGKRQVVLQDLSHGPGVGWYVQKTIRLDREQVDALLASLCCARHGGSFPCPELPRSCPEAEKQPGASAAGARILHIERLLKS